MPSEPIDLSNEPAGNPPPAPPSPRRPYLGIHFACCGVYARIYTNASGSAFVGHCPRCARRVEVGISPEGESERFFSAY